MNDPGSTRGFPIGTYRTSLRRVPRVQVGNLGKTMQAEYRILSADRCRFWTRFPWAFPQGERPPGYKGVVGDIGVLFSPFGVARWAGHEFRAQGYLSRWRVLLCGGFTAFFFIAGVDAVWRDLLLDKGASALVGLASSVLPAFIGAFWWHQEECLFRAIAQEVANDLERENLGDAEQRDEADER
jgi:hypothetical protein